MTKCSTALDDMFGALAHPTRRAMVERLARGPASVSELARPTKAALPTVVQHLRLLERSGLVSSRKVGRVRTFRIEPERLDHAQRWLAGQRALWEARFDRLDTLLLQGETKDD